MAMHTLHCAVSTLREERLVEQCPAGERKDCQTPEGVNDMTGNLWEWTASGRLHGGNWNFSKDLLSVSQRSMEYGFRCCL